MKPILFFAPLGLCFATAHLARAQESAASATAPIAIAIDAGANRRPIDARIYGTNYASSAQLKLLGATMHRMGGNNTSRYNWQLNADNRGNDWFFESIADDSATPGARADQFVQTSRDGGATPMLTIPMIDWIAKTGARREKLASFSIRKYGAQQKSDQWMPDAGNGTKADGTPVSGNDPNDANVRNSPALQSAWVRHLIQKWGAAARGGVRYYILDNEPALWNSTHRDVQPQGLRMSALRDKIIAYSQSIKAIDPNAKIAGPEEWGWTGYFYSGYDSQLAPTVNWDASKLPDRKSMNGQDALPWLLQQLRAYDAPRRTRTLDVFTVHFYPQGGEGGNDVSPAMQEKRNRSTRALWDANYTDQSWINDKINLIPRLKTWARGYRADLETGITEYNWGAENHINGATTQADILGIFGREGLNLATRWTTPPTDSPTFKAMQLFRNADNRNRGFGDLSIRCVAPNPDQVSAFAALRSSDRALTVMLINKQIGKSAPVNLSFTGFNAQTVAQGWQLTAKNRIESIAVPNVQSAKLNLTLPAQSVTLLVMPKL